MPKKNTPTTGDVDVEAAQPTLPTLELPAYHGRRPTKQKTSITGTGNRLTGEHAIGAHGVAVIEYVCKSAGHGEDDDGLFYAEKHAVVDLFEIAGDAGTRLLSTLRTMHRTAADHAEGRASMFGDTGHTDASGVVLLPDEVAAIKGFDPVRSMVDDSLTPCVVVYRTTEGAETRLVWPGEYAAGTARPNVGDAHPDDHEEGVDADRVVRLLHHATGETLAATDDDGDPVDPAGADDWDRDADDWDTGADDYDNPPEPDPTSTEPTAHDFTFVDCPIGELRGKLAEVADLVLLERALHAEQLGRGRGLVPRAGAVKAITSRIEIVTTGGA